MTLFLVAIFGLTLAAGDADQNPSKKTDSDTTIKWMSYDEGLALSRAEGKPLFVNFTTSWCGWCKKMNKTTFIEPEVVEMLNTDFIPVKVDGESGHELDIEGYKITEKNLSRKEYRVSGYPTYWFLEADGKKLGSLSGYQPTTNLMSALEFVKTEKYKEQAQTKETDSQE
jgi:thioredoxin-related protein